MQFVPSNYVAFIAIFWTWQWSSDSVSATTVQAESLQERWAIEGPELIWAGAPKETVCSSSSFFLEYIVSPHAQHPRHLIFENDCHTPIVDPVFASSVLQLMPHSNNDDTATTTTASTTPTPQRQKIVMELTPIHHHHHHYDYHDHSKPLQVCIRMSLFTGPNPDGDMEVNLKESLVTIRMKKKTVFSLGQEEEDRESDVEIQSVELTSRKLRSTGSSSSSSSSSLSSSASEPMGGIPRTTTTSLLLLLLQVLVSLLFLDSGSVFGTS